MDDDEWKKRNSKSKENKIETEDIDQTKKENKKKLVGGLSKYEKTRAKNIAELQVVMESLKEKYPFQEDLVPRSASKKPAEKKEKKERQQPVERQVLKRNKGGNNGRYVYNCDVMHVTRHSMLSTALHPSWLPRLCFTMWQPWILQLLPPQWLLLLPP